MKTKEQYYKEQEEIAKRKAIERKIKWRNEVSEEIREWSYVKLREEYIKCRLSRISYSGGISIGWKYIHDDCRFCGLEYTQGKYDDCCDDCFEENKDKTLAELL